MPQLQRDPLGRPIVQWSGQILYLEQNRYGTGHLRLDLVDSMGFPYTTASHNVPEAELPPNHICIKNWRENAGVLEALVAAGVVRWTGQMVETGNEDAHLCELLIEVTAPEIEGRSVAELRAEFLGRMTGVFGQGIETAELHAWPGRRSGRIHGQPFSTPKTRFSPITERQNPAITADVATRRRAMGRLTLEEALGLHVCADCQKPVNVETDFHDELSRREYGISGKCQTCQDRFFT